MGTTFDGKGLEKYVEEMQQTNPDVVVITGDFVDDDTSKQDMIDACHALSKLNPTYGVYFVFGNHDKGYYDPEYRGYDRRRPDKRIGKKWSACAAGRCGIDR